MSTQNVLEALKQRSKYCRLSSRKAEFATARWLTHPHTYKTKILITHIVIQEQGLSGQQQQQTQEQSSRQSDSSAAYIQRDSRSSIPESRHTVTPRERDTRDSRGGHLGYRDSRGHDDRRGGYRDHRDEGDSRHYKDTDYRSRDNYRHDYRDSRDSRDYRDRDRRNGRRNNDRGGYDRGAPAPRRDNRGGRYDRYDRYDDRRGNFRDGWRREDRERDSEKDENWRTEDLSNVVSIDKLERQSLWDVMPKGFEKVSSERAKISGLFPLPGEARRVDISKLEGLVNGGDLNNHTSILFEQIKIDAASSRRARELIITGVEFSLYPVERLVGNITNYINTLNIEGSFIVNYELVNNKYLVLHLSNHRITTILYSSVVAIQKELNLKIRIARPEAYVVPTEEDENTIVPDSPNKIAILNVPSDITEEEMKEDLEDIVSRGVSVEMVKSIDGSSKGVMFAQFPPSVNPQTAIEKINAIVIRDCTLQAILACEGLSQPEKVTFRSMGKVAYNHTQNIESSVIVLLNTIQPEELKKETAMERLEKDVLEICSHLGKVETIKIPKPAEDYKRNYKNLNTSVGKVFVKFASSQDAKKAALDLNGRKYNERTVLVSYVPVQDFELDLF